MLYCVVLYCVVLYCVVLYCRILPFLLSSLPLCFRLYFCLYCFTDAPSVSTTASFPSVSVATDSPTGYFCSGQMTLLNTE